MANPNGTPGNLRPKPWPKGVSGNPKGYSRGRRQIDDLMELINSEKSEREISQVWLKCIMDGNFVFLREYLERRDGKVASAVEIDTKRTLQDVIQELDTDAIGKEDSPSGS